MTNVALCRSGVISPILSFLQGAGTPVEPILQLAGLPPWITSDSEALVPATSPSRLFGAAKRQTGIENLGLITGSRAPMEALGIFGRLIRRSSTLGEALERAVRYNAMHSSSGPMWLAQRGDQVQFCRASSVFFEARDVGRQEASHFCLGLMIGVVRLAAGPGWRPAEVHLQTDEAPGLRDAELLAGARIAFRQPALMVAIPRRLLATRLPPCSANELAPDGVADWTSSAPVHDFVGSMRQAVEALSGGGYPTIEQTADFVGLSVRTLQRRLAAAELTHDLLIAEVRFATAARVLAETDAKILDLALDLGYADHANFTRAFRRWAGCSPQEYRSRHRSH